jgi:hypothetical protein
MSVEDKYKLYLSRVGLFEPLMNTQQRIQLRQTYFAAVFETLKMVEQIGLLTEDERKEKFAELESELNQYFLFHQHINREDERAKNEN